MIELKIDRLFESKGELKVFTERIVQELYEGYITGEDWEVLEVDE